MGNSTGKLQKLGIHSDQPIGKEEFEKLWKFYSNNDEEKMSIHASRKFLKEFAVMTGFTYQEYLAEMIIGYCSHRNGELTKDQFEELLVQAAHSTDLILDESIGDNYRMIIDSQKRRIFKQNLRRLDEIQQDEVNIHCVSRLFLQLLIISIFLVLLKLPPLLSKNFYHGIHNTISN